MWQKIETLGHISAVAVWPCLREREQVRHEAEELARKKNWCLSGCVCMCGVCFGRVK